MNATTRNQSNVQVTITVKFGSTFQKDIWVNGLIGMIKVWKALVLTKHKRNRVEYKYRSY